MGLGVAPQKNATKDTCLKKTRLRSQSVITIMGLSSQHNRESLYDHSNENLHDDGPR